MEKLHPATRVKAAEIAAEIMEHMGTDLLGYRPQKIEAEGAPKFIFDNLFDAIYEKMAPPKNSE